MTILEGISDSPQQQITVPLVGGTTFILSLAYSLQQGCWFYSISWNGNPVCNGQRLVASPNILYQYVNVIPFGLAVVTNGDVEPSGIEDLSDGTATVYLLQGTDITLVGQTSFGLPAQPLPATAVTSGGSQVIIPPTSWGPASGDLSGSYPGPSVIAIHEGGGQQLTISPIPNNAFLQRVGNSLVGAFPSGVGNVVGPASSVSGNFPAFNGTTGILLSDSGTSPASITAAIAAAVVTAEAACYPGLGLIPLSALATMTASSLLGNPTGSAIKPEPITLGAGLMFSGSTLVATGSGSGDVVGPAGAVSLNLAAFNGTTGLIIEDSGISSASITAAIAACLASAEAASYPGLGAIPQTAMQTLAAVSLLGNPTGSARTPEGITLGAGLSFSGTTLVAAGGGGIPTSGATGQRLVYGGSSGTAAWGNDALIYAEDYSYGAAGNTNTQNSTALNNAIAAAITNQAAVILPPGTFHINGAVAITTSGFVGVRGCGRKVSRIIQDAANANGFTVNLAGGVVSVNVINSAVEFADFSLLMNSGVTGTTGIFITYGSTPGLSISDRSLSSCTNVGVEGVLWTSGSNPGGGWTNGFSFYNCWNLAVTNCFAAGNLGNYFNGSGAGTGSGFLFTSCENAQVTQCTANGWGVGFNLPVAGSGLNNSSVMLTNINAVECGTCLYSNTCTIYLTNFLFDNGNTTGNQNKVCINLVNDSGGNGGSYIVGGQILQTNYEVTAQAMITLNNCKNLSISEVDTSNSNNTKCSVWFTGGSSSNRVINCSPNGGTFALGDSGTNVNVVRDNGPSINNTDNGANEMGDVLSAETIQTLTATATFAFSIGINGASLGKAATNVFIQCVSNIGSGIMCTYDQTNGGNNATTAFFKAWMTNLGALPAGAHQFQFTVFP